jgi:hypothetical protein
VGGDGCQKGNAKSKFRHGRRTPLQSRNMIPIETRSRHGKLPRNAEFVELSRLPQR